MPDAAPAAPPAAARHRFAPTVGQRLFLAVVPAILAVVLVVALAYYGEYAHEAPEVVVVAAAALALLSLGVTWRNTRDLARRIERLAGRGGEGNAGRVDAPANGADELDRIERTVDSLGSALSASEAERARAAADAAARLRDQAELLAVESAAAIARLDGVRLPLHILLDAHFGELTPNQEELLADARDAALAADAALRRLRALADADRGALAMQREWVTVADVLAGVVPAARARAERGGGRLDVEAEPALPRVVADRARLAEALALLLDAAVAEAGAGPTQVRAVRDQGGVALTLAPAPPRAAQVLPQRLLAAQGAGAGDAGDGTLRLTLGTSLATAPATAPGTALGTAPGT